MVDCRHDPIRHADKIKDVPLLVGRGSWVVFDEVDTVKGEKAVKVSPTVADLSGRKQGFDPPWGREPFRSKKLIKFGLLGGWLALEICEC